MKEQTLIELKNKVETLGQDYTVFNARNKAAKRFSGRYIGNN